MIKLNKIRNVLIIAGFLCISTQNVDAEEILSWVDCVKEAQKNNPDLISAVENIKQQDAAKGITASGLFPQVSASAAASKAQTGTATATAKSDSYSYGVTGNQLVFDGFKTINDVKTASENIKASQEGYRFTSSEVRLNLRSAFIDLLNAQELIRVTEEIIKIRRDNFMLVTLQYMSGLEHRGALLTAEANMAEANFELAQAKRNVESAQRELIKQIGRKEFSPVYAKGDFIVRDPAKEKPSFEVLVKNNPSVLQAAFKKSAALYGIKSAYGNFAPEVSGTAGASKKSSQWPPQNNQWNLGMSVNMPIFEGGLRTAQVSQAQAAYNQTEADERSIKDAAIVNLEQAWANLQDAVETVDVRDKILKASEERSKIAEAQYSTGFISFDNWIIIEDDLVSAKKSYLQAQSNALSAEANWIQAKGETLEYAQ